ncbi:MAG: tRNA (N6-isopentenyl adenosine(37)-C2)-methylthiotransferase MiaB [Thermanaerothrix sp.]|nr:tRNA (N6-isopentenyl adenosine(37)-C2)-methylthiotransferase MiaB [Thermanaerothrix sp.]
MSTFNVNVFGCQMNVYDGDKLKSAFLERGWTQGEPGSSDVEVYVTCSIRDKAEQKVLSEIGRFGKLKNPPLVVLVGCMAQRTGSHVAARFPWVRVVAGPRHLGMVPQAVEDSLKDLKVRMLLDDDPRETDDLCCTPHVEEGMVRGYVTIAHGCDHFCAYCIVPYVRGRFRSRDGEEILREVRELAQKGVKELTLLGQNVNRYGKDLPNGPSFPELLRMVSRVEGLVRVRFATNHPVDFSRELVEVMATEEKVCPSINLPVQSGSDRVLRLMGRGYTREQYLEMVRMLRDAVPDVGITSDLIVGFPGETEEDFMDSLDLLERVRFDLVHTAAYSVRPGTRAERMEGHLDVAEKARRLNRVNQLQAEISLDISRSWVGRTCPVLVEGPAPKGQGLWHGRTPQDKVVLFQGPSKVGEVVPVKITSALAWYLQGELA